MKMTTEQKLEIALEALEKIANPIKFFRQEAEKQGAKLDGFTAVQIAKDGNWLSGVADKALTVIETESI